MLETVRQPRWMPSEQERLVVGWFHAMREARKAAARESRPCPIVALMVRRALEAGHYDALAERDAWERSQLGIA